MIAACELAPPPTDTAPVRLPPSVSRIRSAGSTSRRTRMNGPSGGAGKALGAAATVDLPALEQALEAALAGVHQLGAAREGDKTMVDALAPATRAFGKAIAEGASAAGALSALADAAAAGAAATVSMQARKGRASYLGPRSVGHEDPGAASTALILAALRDVVAR